LPKKTDGEVGGPIAVLSETVAHILRDVDERGEIGIARHRVGVVEQLRYEIVGRASDHCDQDPGKKQQPSPDSELLKHGGSRSARGHLQR